MGDVITYLEDGTSGIVTGGVDGSALVVGVCSKGTVGKGYLIGKRSNLEDILGVGPLTEHVRDMLATAGQEPNIVAVPVQGQQAGYITDPVITGSEVVPTVSGVPAQNADIVVRVATPGAVGTATVEISTDGGKTFGEAQASAEQLVLKLEDEEPTGATLVFPAEATLEADATFAVTVRCAVGPVTRIGEASSPLITAATESGVLAGAELVVQIVKGGALNEGTYQLSTDGGDNFDRERTIPVDGKVVLSDFGVTVTFPSGTYTAGTTYSCRLLAPAPSIVDVMSALEGPLAIYDVEYVLVAGETDSVDWAAAQTKADELWNLQRPTYFKMETRLPRDGEDLNDFAAYLLAESQGFAGRFVTVCCQYGEVTDTTGATRLRNAGGLQAGRVMSIPVQRATGRVRDGNVSQLSLPENWESVQSTLEEDGYLTAKKYAGLEGVYWGDSRTMADDTSDYRYEEVLRTVFKAVRLLRNAALKSMYDEAGDPLKPNSTNGLAYLKANLENALDTMVKANPQELASYVVDIASGQDIVNNGVAVDVTLIGIPIIREIKLYASYVYAGSTFDPRMSDSSAA
ncbi:MAG TPA: DUF2586 domain-containing protein [Candidatus Desulfovibrio intestinipullorum]|uniref:DUF2586 domain-containing protein n=1 Tax=Candidatus Desulfovibrio intestinipullorum TaxID=2838536 RepID=A0A9D1TQA8_9BACT|nr:DUF2586 domain-containing protein [Candidatus Desulfovibrio intestinipullorum]